MQRLIKHISSKLGVAVNASYDKEEKKWFVHAGSESALYVHVSLTANGLAYAAERILPALDKPAEEKKGIIRDTLYWLLTNNPE
jgi:protein-S-isoprenylcysteine O-methyltransferase Ste14